LPVRFVRIDIYMITSFWGFKKGQSQIFDEKGKMIPVSFIEVKPVVAVRFIDEQKDGYWAIQVGIGEQKRKKTTKAILGFLEKAGIKKTPRFFRELKVGGEIDLKAGDAILASDVFNVGDIVAVSGKSRGKGFAGVVKRWGFAGGPRTHGQSDRQRAPGSIGQTTTPGRVFKGKKMAGRMGGVKKTVLGLEVVGIDREKEELIVLGLIPGAKGGLIEIKLLVKGKQEEKEEGKNE